MSVRKRTWRTPTGELKTAFVCDYIDGAGVRRLRTFASQGEAKRWASQTAHELQQGVHTPASTSPTVREAADTWIKSLKSKGKERASIEGYEGLLRCHLLPNIGNVKLSALNRPTVNRLRDKLLASGLGAPTVHKTIGALKLLLGTAMDDGLIAQNVAKGVKVERSTRGRRLVPGKDIPLPEEIGRIVAATTGTTRTLVMVAAFTGLRSSELRGLRWSDVDLKGAKLTVGSRLDRYQQRGNPKSKAGTRTLPLAPELVTVLREHKLASPPNAAGLVFATQPRGRPYYHTNLLEQFWHPAQVKAGVTTAGEAKYSGLHATRHFFASSCINRRVDGGRELPPKSVQYLLGHASIVVTLDIYGHLFPSSDNPDELAASVAAVLRAT
jgi:integrase